MADDDSGGNMNASIKDFVVSDGAALPPEGLLTDPNISLYSLDDANQRAIFVEMSNCPLF